MSTARIPSVVSQSATRRLESLCARTCVATSAGFNLPVQIPAVSAESSSNGFVAQVQVGDDSAFRVECTQSAASWTGDPESLSVWIVDENNRSYRCVDPERLTTRSEAISANDRLVAVSKSICRGLDSIDSVLEMALCDEPSLSTAASWILDAADDADLDGPHIVILWRAV